MLLLAVHLTGDNIIVDLVFAGRLLDNFPHDLPQTKLLLSGAGRVAAEPGARLRKES